MLIVLVLILSAAAIFLKNKFPPPGAWKSSDTDAPTLAAKAEKSGNIGDYYDGTPAANAPATSTTNPSLPSLNIYAYPGAKTKSQTGEKLELESNDSPEKITDWYKKKINALNFNAKSFAQTNTNDNILNKLSAAKPGEKLDITIKKDQTTSNVLIVVDRS